LITCDKILLLGGSGLLGTALQRAGQRSGIQLWAPRRDEVDICQLDLLQQAVQTLSPRLLLNAAAQASVDQAQKDPAQAFAVNALGAHNCALVAAEAGLPLMHISSDYVFDGARREPYREYHFTGTPPNEYGCSKLEGELLVRQHLAQHFIVRVSALFGEGGRPDFVDWVLEKADPAAPLRIVADRFTSPTWTDDLAQQLLVLASTPFFGTYHAAGQGVASWFELARSALALSDRDQRGVVPVLDMELESVARRAPFTALENHLLRLRGLERMRPWREALRLRLGGDDS
jgi:dTDP-4-dehydrorhamnose reductase